MQCALTRPAHMVTIAGCSNNACENRLGVIWLHDCSNYLTFPRLVSLTAWHIQMILLFGLVVVQCIHSQWVEINYEGEFYFHAAVLKILVKKWSAYAQYKYWQTPNFQWYRATFKDPEPSQNTVCPSAQPVWMSFFISIQLCFHELFLPIFITSKIRSIWLVSSQNQFLVCKIGNLWS